MSRKLEREERARAIRMGRGHLAEYGSITATCDVVGPGLGIGDETLRRWIRQSDADAGAREGVTTAEADEIARLKAGNKRLRVHVAILKAAKTLFVGKLGAPRAVLSSLGGAERRFCRILSEHGCQIAARAYRSWTWSRVSRRGARDALLSITGTAESPNVRRKMTAFLRRGGHPGVATRTVDRLMRDLGMNGVRHGRAHRMSAYDLI